MFGRAAADRGLVRPDGLLVAVALGIRGRLRRNSRVRDRPLECRPTASAVAPALIGLILQSAKRHDHHCPALH
jgi:hypothetical protein